MNTQTTAAPAAAAKPQARMTLGAITKGKIAAPDRIVIYGLDGVGKTSFAAGAPKVIFLPTEDGTNQLAVARFPIARSIEDVYDAIRELMTAPHDYETLAIDNLGGLEPMIWDALVKADGKAATIEDVGGGFQKGYIAAVDRWRSLLGALEQLRAARNMRIILVDHAVIRNFKNPDGPDFDRFEMKIHHKAAGKVREWADTVLFAQHETFAVKDKDKGQKAKGVSDGSRVMHSTRMAAWDAKSRYSIPDVLPLGWDDYASAVAANEPTDHKELEAEAIANAEKLASVESAARAKAAIAAASGDAAELAKLNNRLKTQLNKQEVANG